MKNKNYLLLGLWALVTVVAVGVAWQQYWKAAGLQAMLAGSGAIDLQQKLTSAEQRSRALEIELEARRDAAKETTGETASANPTRANGNNGRGGRGDFAAMMDRPEMVRLRTLQQRAALDSRFAPLFKSLSLSPEKLVQFKNLLAERESTMQDVMMAAREQGVDPRADPAAFRKLVATAQAEVDSQLKAVLGDEAYAQYQQYSQTQPQRATVEQLRASLSYTSDPLSETQATQLTQILAATAPASADGASAGPPPEGGGRGPGGPGGGGAGGAPITNEAVVQAQTVLTTTQLAALQQMQTLQQAQQAAMQALRSSESAVTPATGNTTATGRRGSG